MPMDYRDEYDETNANQATVSTSDFAEMMERNADGSKHNVQIDGMGRIRVEAQDAENPDTGTVNLTRRRAWY